MRRLTPFLAVLIGALGLTLSACDGMTALSEKGDARLTVRLIDAPFPFDLVDSANVTISGVEIRTEDEKFSISDSTFEFNLLDLRNGVSALLGDITIPAGTYREVRLTVEDASIVLKDGQEFDMDVPSGRIKVLLDDLTIEEGQAVTLTLDFDVSKSFVVQGNPNTPAGIKGFKFKPTVVPARIETDEDDDDEQGDDDGDDADDDDEGEDDGDDEGEDDDSDDDDNEEEEEEEEEENEDGSEG